MFNQRDNENNDGNYPIFVRNADSTFTFFDAHNVKYEICSDADQIIDVLQRYLIKQEVVLIYSQRHRDVKYRNRKISSLFYKSETLNNYFDSTPIYLE
jgi:hypothetical protein